jgi:hypothetical protein
VSDLVTFLNAQLDAEEKWWASEHDRTGVKDRALREIAAKRAILARYEDCLARQEDDDYPTVTARDQAREYEDFVLPNLTAVYSNRPGYDPEWNPGF